MSNVTPLFKKYVNVFLEDSNIDPETTGKAQPKAPNKYLINDTFIKECLDLLKGIRELQRVVISIEEQYKAEGELSEREKDDFDTEVRLIIQQYFDKLRFLGDYENKRQQIINSRYTGNGSSEIMSLFRLHDEKLEQFHLINNKHREGILQSLNMLLSSVFSKISNMQQERLLRQRELESIDFNAQLYAPIHNMISSVSQSPAIETTEQEIAQYNEAVEKLSQQQLQILEAEHDNLLNIKTQELQNVEKLSRTMIEISSLQNEITSQLKSQTQNIFTLLDNHDDVELDVQQGNKQLKKAQKRSGKSARLIIYLSVLFGILILFLDLIN